MGHRPAASSPEALRRMRSTRQRDTNAEVALRRVLYAMGLRYRLHRSIIPGVRRRPDIVFPAAKVAVFVDGCFWHSCPVHGTLPKANASWWAAKLRANALRDADTDRRLQEVGWHVVRVWEHEAPAAAAVRVASAIDKRRAREVATRRRLKA